MRPSQDRSTVRDCAGLAAGFRETASLETAGPFKSWAKVIHASGTAKPRTRWNRASRQAAQDSRNQQAGTLFLM